jgi:hypothetical protein
MRPAPKAQIRAISSTTSTARCSMRPRSGLARWRRLAEHVPPSEVVDTVIRESAYALKCAAAG